MVWKRIIKFFCWRQVKYKPVDACSSGGKAIQDNIKYFILSFIISSCGNDSQINGINKVEINPEIKSGINFTKPTDSLSYHDFYRAGYKNALLKRNLTTIHTQLQDTFKNEQEFTKCACIKDKEKLTIVFNQAGDFFHSTELFIVLKGDSAYALNYLSGDLGVRIDTLDVKQLSLNSAVTDTSNYLEGIIKLNYCIANQNSKSTEVIDGKFKCGIYPKSKTDKLIPKIIE